MKNLKKGGRIFDKKQKTLQKDEFLLKYQCRPPMEPKYIKDEDSIANILNDNGEFLYGMNLAAAYQKFNEWQKKILENITSKNNQNDILLYCREQILKKINIQDATFNEIISFNKNEYSNFNNLEEIITTFSKRNCINKDGSINYSNYKLIEYDLDSIEEEISKIILPAKKFFEPEFQKFVIYGYECYRGDNSTVICDFIDKYSNNLLLKQEKKILYDFSKEKTDCTNFMFSLQLLIFYLKNENYNPDVIIKDAIKNIPDYINISDDCKEFFENNPNFKLNSLLSIYEYIELLCYPKILENINDDYKIDIEQEEINKINTYFNNENEKLISKKLIVTPIRKLISRFLSGKRRESEIKEDINLLYFLQSKKEFWDKDLFDNDNFENEFEDMINSFTINVNQAIKFYDILGGGKELLDLKKEFEEEYQFIELNSN